VSSPQDGIAYSSGGYTLSSPFFSYSSFSHLSNQDDDVDDSECNGEGVDDGIGDETLVSSSSSSSLYPRH